MRIGIDARILNSRRRTGIGVYAHNLVRSLASLYANDRILLLYPALAGREIDGWGYEEFPNLAVKRSLVPDNIREERFFRLWLDFYLPLATRRRRLDIFHGPANLIPSSGRYRRVLTVHDLSFLVTPELAFDCSQAFVERFLRGVEGADAIVAVSKKTGVDLIRHCGADAEKISVVYEGVDSRFRVMDDGTARDEWRSRLGLPSDFILGPLSLHPRKNCLNLIRAYALARERGCRHFLVLPGKDYGRSECYRLVEELGIGDRVIFTGYMGDDAIMPLYNLASAFVYPSLYEGFGLPILEAMSCGCPVVTSGRGSIPEVAGDAALCVDPCSVEELARAVACVLEDGGLRRSLVERGRERALRFTWERCARETHAVYEKVLNQ